QLSDGVYRDPRTLAGSALRSVIEKLARAVAVLELVAFTDNGRLHTPHLAAPIGQLDHAAIAENENGLALEGHEVEMAERAERQAQLRSKPKPADDAVRVALQQLRIEAQVGERRRLELLDRQALAQQLR